MPNPRSVIVSRLRAAGCVFAEDEARLLSSEARTPDELTTMVDRRAAGLPLEHVLGWAQFCGLRMAVDPGVFVPRRRSELLVRQARALLGRATDPGDGAPDRPPAVVVDLCCGSGAVGGAVLAGCDGVELHAVDIDPGAVRCARRNLAATGGRAYLGDLYEPLPGTLRGRVDVLVVNAPYVPSDEVDLLPREARSHEPLVALDGGADGLVVARRVTAGATQWLAPGGHLLVETSKCQASQACEIFACQGLAPRVASCDERDATVVIGSLPAGAVAYDANHVAQSDAQV